MSFTNSLLSPFQTILYPRTKTSFVPFYRKPYADNPDGSVIQAPFTRAGAGRKVIDASGNLVDAAANLPAWTFPIGGSSAGCHYLSFLPSVENLLTYSEQFDNAAWTKSNATISADAATSPDGTASAEKIVATAATSQHLLNQTDTLTASTDYTLSVFLKKGEYRYAAIQTANVGNWSASKVFRVDLELGIQASTSPDDGIIIDMGNGWYYCALEATFGGSNATGGMNILLSDGTSETFTGDGTSGVYAWGAMLKEGSYISPLDYIPTEASAVTRAQDSITNISDLQGDGYLSSTLEGSVIFQVGWETSLSASANRRFLFRDSSGSTRLVSFVHREALQIYDDVAADYVSVDGVDSFIPEKSLVRLVYSWNASGIKIYYNGFLIYSASGSYPIARLEDLRCNDTSGGGGLNFKMLNFAPTALTATEAEAASSWPSFELMASDLGYV